MGLQQLKGARGFIRMFDLLGTEHTSVHVHVYRLRINNVAILVTSFKLYHIDGSAALHSSG